MDDSSDKKLRIAIIGAGIGGLTCALALKDRTDIEINLYEAAAEISEIGAGFLIWPRTWDILKSMGVEEDLIKISPREEPSESNGERTVQFTFRKSDQSNGYMLFEFLNSGNSSSIPLHRQEMQKLLLKHLPPSSQLHLKHTLDHCEESKDSVKLYFKNGVISSCDLVIGADGVRSATRQSLLAQHPEPSRYPNNAITYAGVVCYRGLIPREKMEAVNPNHPILKGARAYCGVKRHIVVYPISKGTMINVGAFVFEEDPLAEAPPRRDVTNETVLSYFTGWEEEAQQLLSLIENPIGWPLQDLKPLDTYVSSRIAVLGDAAHATTPHLAAGACQAIEDAYILGNLLVKSNCNNNAEDLSRILKAYDATRQPFGNFIVRTSREVMSHMGLNRPEYEGVGDELSAEQLGCFREALMKGDAWRWESAEPELERALSML